MTTPLILKALTRIDPEIGWIEIVQYNNKQAATIANLVDQTWLFVYPLPKIVTYEQVNEFLGNAFKKDIIETEYVVKAKCATTENPQASSILERIHRFIAKLVRMFDLKIIILTSMTPGQGYQQLQILR